MVSKMKLQTRLLVTGCILTALPLLIVSGLVYYQNHKALATTEQETTRLADTNLNQIVRSVYDLVRTHQEVNQQNVAGSLNVAREVAARSGGFSFSEETAQWNAVNQFTKAAVSVDLPKMMAGDTWLGQVSDAKTPVRVVDRVQEMLGVTCTVFQRMNPQGDMLRIATNVIKKDGKRAIGTYIPATQADGSPNPVVSTVLKGRTFHGRAYVVNGWYITAYEPIYDAQNQIVGMLYVGIPQEGVKSLREAVMGITVGKTGYVYVLDSKGNYVISKDGKRDGEDISLAKDSDGNLFIQEICRKALNSKPGEITEQTYPWQNQGEDTARVKLAKIMYFEPWDWVIGAGSYIDEFMDASRQIGEMNRRSNIILLLVLAGSLVAVLVIWYFIARGIAGPIQRSLRVLTGSAEQVSSASHQIASSSHSLADGAATQAASIEETSSSLEEMSSMTKQNASSSNEADSLMKEANQVIIEADASMEKLTLSMKEISSASEETQKIIKTIDEIAFQTNLLALNAAVEAARAGEAGAGFAVVADEVRNLALRAADAARNTATLIEGTVKKIKDGSGLVEVTSEAFGKVAESADTVGGLVAEISAASSEQAQGIEQINHAVAEMDKSVQQVAANAEESASASEEMNAQAEQMRAIVNDLLRVIDGNEGAGRERTVRTPTAAPSSLSRKPAGRTRLALKQGKKVDPEQVIPFDDDEVNEF